METSRITQEYLENIRENYKSVNQLVDGILLRAVEDAKQGYNNSNTQIYNSEYNRDTMWLAYGELRKRKFIVVLRENKTVDFEGHIGEISIYFNSKEYAEQIRDENIEEVQNRYQEVFGSSKHVD